MTNIKVAKGSEDSNAAQSKLDIIPNFSQFENTSIKIKRKLIMILWLHKIYVTIYLRSLSQSGWGC
ncbi:hypothetical protein [Paenibacillus endoradicis]|uniref:hypothetical protein n=1 Tax=Paenibacillus endoradicis TaxID=2972487 RepID=UPI0021597ED7|nr:hypothetical protein [Paenibacillus endoradicis]